MFLSDIYTYIYEEVLVTIDIFSSRYLDCISAVTRTVRMSIKKILYNNIINDRVRCLDHNNYKEIIYCYIRQSQYDLFIMRLFLPVTINNRARQSEHVLE